MSQKKYRVIIHYDIAKTFEVYARNKEEAERIAMEQAEGSQSNLNKWDFCNETVESDED